MTLTPETQFDPAQAPYPYASEEGEPYIFPLTDYPTEEAVRTWLKWSSADLGVGEEWEWDIRRGQYLVHEHDEDFKGCVPDACPKTQTIEGWLVE